MKQTQEDTVSRIALFSFQFRKKLGCNLEIQNQASSQYCNVERRRRWCEQQRENQSYYLHICQCNASSRSTARCNACGQSHHLGFSSHTPENHTQQKKYVSANNDLHTHMPQYRTSLYDSYIVKTTSMSSSSVFTWYSSSGFTHFGLQDSSRYFFGSTTSSSALKY